MESSFFEDLAFNWSLYSNMFVQGLLIALTLATIGVPMVARNQIFKGAAISSASTLGIALALMIAQFSSVHHHTPDDIHADEWLHSDSFKTVMAVAAAIESLEKHSMLMKPGLAGSFYFPQWLPICLSPTVPTV